MYLLSSEHLKQLFLKNWLNPVMPFISRQNLSLTLLLVMLKEQTPNIQHNLIEESESTI